MAEMLTVLEVIQRSSAFLEGKGVESPRLNAEWLIASALGMDRMKLYMQFDRPLRERELADMRSLVARRAKREPLQYILGSTPFHELDLKVDARALIPRPETEQLVEKIVDFVGGSDHPLRILDLGTGTGAIALALAYSLPHAEILAVDESAEALQLAEENALRNGLQNRVRFLQSDWFEAIPIELRFELIVSNPPYLTLEELHSAQPEVKDHEPRAALVADDAGLADLRLIVQGAGERLAGPGSSLWMETGIAHREALSELCLASGFLAVEGLDDWSGRPRFIKAIK
ncbi:peptide chain release factor N(5)-glutamine methyltransferase [Pelagicoccus sp. SDUM812003]|uniref:peptide chain release factor N(5)-glutamine methyltransferase n=1 Tax=Pelagicoccus sp. SDUM812003 TaxID=3041267 RepID=UPI00280CD384|nr:peptide chain release factor N(5)-glutamine methyltransferase [Pelagicoccus sp. SDUM812003]MDQ8205173.1 peptide chain release factor N(5)-glutamine methyltransferase [Pelagicoccus sp. SDUM812003]